MVSFLLLAFLQLLIFIVILVKFPLKEATDRYLLLIAIGGTLALLSKLILYRLDADADENLVYTISSTLCFTAMSHLYMTECFAGKRFTTPVILLHLLPYGFSCGYFCHEWIRLLGGQLPNLQEIGMVSALENYLRTISLVGYLAMDIRLLALHRSAIRDRLHTVNGKLSLYFVIHKILLLALILGSSFMEVPTNRVVLFLGLISMPVVVFGIMYYKIFIGMKQAMAELNGKVRGFLANKETKYAKSKLDDGKYEGYREQIMAYLEREQPFLGFDFTLQQLAEGVGLSNHDVSVTLNSKMDTTFYQLINTQRVEHFLQHTGSVLHGEKTILAAAYESGFNSKSTFNKYFKSVTGQSPRDFLKERGIKNLTIT